jgi:CRISPR system Cascade subunit CasC
MSHFIQLHLLTFYPPANLNRDDTGRPKTAHIGGVERLRISSQAIKRAVRTSDVFQQRLAGHLGQRTQRLGNDIYKLLLTEGGFETEEAKPIARVLASLFGSPETNPKKELFIKQLAFVSPHEFGRLRAIMERSRKDLEYRSQLVRAAQELALDDSDDDDVDGGDDDQASGKKRKRSKETTKLIKELKSEVLAKMDGAADIAMFGRMLADNPDFNREAAVQVAHAITTHRVTVEDDYYTAVDDLKTAAEDAGAGFIGELGFGAGVFYLYVCIDVDLLLHNLGGESSLARTTVEALVEALATVSPGGKQASFASRARASYILVENGQGQPRTLAGAFLKPITGDDPMSESKKSLCDFWEKMETAYGASTALPTILDVEAGKGSLAAVVASAASALG